MSHRTRSLRALVEPVALSARRAIGGGDAAMAPRFAASPRATLETSAPSFRGSSRAFASIRAAPRSLVGFEPIFSIVPGHSRPVGSSRGLRSSAVAGSVGKLVVVESPAKATSVQKYLGDGYTVLASYGHVRDLVQKNGGVKPEDDFSMLWAEKARDGVVRDIVKNAKGAAELLLATDPDREGEAISWHIVELLREKGVLGSSSSLPVKRVTFTEVTKKAVREAFESPREISAPLVDAYLARRALDYLFGFTLSPVLWRKMPGALSAGRVQSAALRLVCEREFEIERFVKEEFWNVFAGLEPDGSSGRSFVGELTHLDGKRLGKMEPGSREGAELAARAVLSASSTLAVHDVVEKDVSRRPRPPFTTSTLQQDASSRLGFGAARTMAAAQSLYEGRGWGEGLITYMRTDGLHVSPAAVAELRDVAGAEFGEGYVPEKPNFFRKVQKNAQEAHEAIRPTKATILPQAVANRLGSGSDEARLYRLIWARTMASQMSAAVTKRVQADVWSEDERLRLKATGSRLIFPGYLAAYRHGMRDGDDSTSFGDNDRWLPRLDVGEKIRVIGDEVKIVERDKDAKRGGFKKADADDDGEYGIDTTAGKDTGVTATQHWTQPPGRYTEGSLVKALEEKGIGRPSTYATIMKVIKRRGYVAGESGRGPLIPETRGRLVSSFLAHFFDEYVDYGFTAGLEDRLDDIASGKEDWKSVLSGFWGPFAGDVESLKGIRTSQVVDVLDATLGAHFFGDDESSVDARLSAIERVAEEAATQAESTGGYPTVAFDPEELSSTRRCPSCGTGRLGLKLSRTGGFIGCSNYPSCGHTRQLVNDGDGAFGGGNFPIELGTDPESGGHVAIENGPYGPYIELQMASSPDDSKKTKPQRFGLKNIGLKPEDVDMDLAMTLLRYPMVLGPHPEDGKDVVMNMGPFGWYVSHDGVNASLSKKVLQKARDDAVAATCGDVSFSDEALVAVEDDFVHVDISEGSDALIEEDTTCDDGRTLDVDQKRKVLLAQHSPVPLDVAVEVLTRKREKPPSERGRWGKKKESTTKGETKAKKVKPEKVKAKRAPSAYILYCNEARSKLPEGLKVPEQAKLLGSQWKALDEKERVKFEKMASEAKAAIADAAPETKAKGKRANSEPKPKRAPSAYILYCNEARSKLPKGLKVPEQAKLLGAQWKTLDAVEKARFEGMAADAKLEAKAR